MFNRSLIALRSIALVPIALALAVIASTGLTAHGQCPPTTPSCNPEESEPAVECVADPWQEGCEAWAAEHCGLVELAPIEIELDGVVETIEGVHEWVCLDDPSIATRIFDQSCDCDKLSWEGHARIVWPAGVSHHRFETWSHDPAIHQDPCGDTVQCDCIYGVLTGCNYGLPPGCWEYAAAVCEASFQYGNGEGAGWVGNPDEGQSAVDWIHDNVDECSDCHAPVTPHPAGLDLDDLAARIAMSTDLLWLIRSHHHDDDAIGDGCWFCH